MLSISTSVVKICLDARETGVVWSSELSIEGENVPARAHPHAHSVSSECQRADLSIRVRSQRSRGPVPRESNDVMELKGGTTFNFSVCGCRRGCWGC